MHVNSTSLLPFNCMENEDVQVMVRRIFTGQLNFGRSKRGEVGVVQEGLSNHSHCEQW